MRSVKVRAAQTDRTLTDVVTELLRSGLSSTGDGSRSSGRVQFPLVRNSRTASAEDFSPERIASILEEDDVASAIEHLTS